MEKTLIFIKHHIGLLWKIIEWGNGFVFSILYKSKLQLLLPFMFDEFVKPPFTFRRLTLPDAGSLHDLIRAQEDSDLEYFSPHGFDVISLRKQFRNRSFLMMGAYDKGEIIGYFFLRFFANKKCFVGRLIDKDYRGEGIGSVMNSIMYETAWRLGFRCFSTISRNNTSVMQAHDRNPKIVVLKELQNDYLLVEFIRDIISRENRVKRHGLNVSDLRN